VTKTKPFSELVANAKTDPVRRARIATYKRAIEDALALADLRKRRGVTPPRRQNGLANVDEPSANS
jgi:hypothetical protein